ncbi:hypothetical protein [Billgrantia gudaonensis]|nr:hypothetical protein [Halomonas gudaonensis]
MGFTAEAVSANSTLVPDGENRAWDVWDCPPETIPNTVRAFELVFPTPELAVRPEQRPTKDWKNVVYIEAAPPGKLTVVTLFVTRGRIDLSHESEPSFWLACLDLGNGYYAQLVAHSDDEGDLPNTIEERIADARETAEKSGETLSDEAYAYFFGQNPGGVRYIFGARLDRPDR